jgi:hypothetical protein
MSTSIDILFLDSQTIGQSGSLERLVQVFTDTDFKIDKIEIEGHSFFWEEYTQKSQEIFKFAYANSTLSFHAINLDWSIEIYQQVAWGEQKMGSSSRAWIRTSSPSAASLWRDTYNNLQHCAFFLEIGKKLYEVLGPSFGWIDLYYGLLTTHEDVESLSLPRLYWANFFGPLYVEKIGRDKLLNAPAWKIEELVDSGILYVLASHLGLNAVRVPLESVREYFGIEKVG